MPILRPIPYGLTVLAIAIGVRTRVYDAWLERRIARGESGLV